jgi:hypothetical protein
MEGANRPRNFFSGPASFPKRRQSRESHAANVAFPDAFRDSFVSSEATRHGPDRNLQNPRKYTLRCLLAALFVAAPILISVILQFMGLCDHCIQSLAEDPFGRVGRRIATSYFALGVSGLVALGLSKLKDKMTREDSREYLKDCNS